MWLDIIADIFIEILGEIAEIFIDKKFKPKKRK